jgi:hypothetical protein
MSIKSQIEADLLDAMRSGDALRKNTLRMALSSIKLAEIDRGASLDEDAYVAILQKEIKSRRESISDAERAGRPELATEAAAEIKIIETYLPAQLDRSELESIAREAIAEVGATSAREMGQVMKILMPRVQGRADGSQVSQVVRNLLG